MFVFSLVIGYLCAGVGVGAGAGAGAGAEAEAGAGALCVALDGIQGFLTEVEADQ